MISAGRVLPMPKGDYNALITYEFLDIVSDSGNSYILKVDTSTGNPPTDTTKWQLLAYGGSAANVAADFAVVETTQYASQAYKVGDFLVDKDSKLCRVTAAILQGSEIIIGTNVEVTSVTALVRTVEESIAVVETKIATYSHDIGDHFYLSDVLYMATAAIQAGDTLTSGTNITPAVDVCTQINELASDTTTALNEVKNIIAPVEATNTAVLSYSVGDQFIHNGALCKAKTAITAGDTLVFNTNYEEAGQVGDQLSSVKQALSDEVEARAKLGASNLWDFEAWLKDGGATYTKSGSIFTVSNIGSLYTNKFRLFDEPTNINVYGSITATGYTTPRLEFLAEDDTILGGFYEGTPTPRKINGVTKVRFNYGGVGSSLVFTNMMVTLSDDPNSDYAPYALTNQQLTESLNNNFVLVRRNEHVDVQTDGTETNETFFKRLKAAALSLINAELDTNETFAITGFTYGNRDFRLLPRTSLGTFSDDFYYSMKIEASLFDIRGIQPYSGTYLMFMFYNNQTSITDVKSTTASGTCSVYYDVYKKIQ